MTTARILASIISLLILASCGLQNSSPDEIAGKEDIYTGIYSQGIEDAWFRPCLNMKESWLFAEVSDSTFYPALSDNRNGFDPLYMELRGIPTEKGKYPGIFTTHNRGFEIKEMIVIREAGENESDCSK
jgi:hypothetical protein